VSPKRRRHERRNNGEQREGRGTVGHEKKDVKDIKKRVGLRGLKKTQKYRIKTGGTGDSRQS